MSSLKEVQKLNRQQVERINEEARNNPSSPRPFHTMVLALVLAISPGLSLANPQSPGPVPAPPPEYDSPRLTALASDLGSGKPDALDKFWAEVKGKSPLVEPELGNATYRRVTFLFRGDANARAVSLLGGMPGPAHFFKPLARFGATDLWFRTERMPSDARFQYNFVLDPPAPFPMDKALVALYTRKRNDPLNPNTFNSQPALELPDAPPQTWSKVVNGVSEGRMTEAKIPSGQLGRERSLSVYTPPGYDPNGELLGLLVLFDGPAYRAGFAPTILNNLLAKKKIAPLVVVFVSQNEREKELACSEALADFLAGELVPWLRKNYRVTDEPARVAVGGFSLGGLMAAYCAFRHSNVFGNVLSQSGSYWWYPGGSRLKDEPRGDDPYGWLTREFVRSKKLPVRFFLAVGTMEAAYALNLLHENRRFRDVLEAKGYVVTYSECPSDHSLLNWRGSFADGVIALFGL